jgi:hypothetical protein
MVWGTIGDNPFLLCDGDIGDTTNGTRDAPVHCSVAQGAR